MHAVPAVDIDPAPAGPAGGGRTAAAWEGFQQYTCWLMASRRTSQQGWARPEEHLGAWYGACVVWFLF